MRWRFWERRESELSKDLGNMKGQIEVLDGKTAELHEQIQKLTRLQFKASKNLEEKVDKLPDLISTQESTAFLPTEPTINKLIQQIDDMDLVCAKLPVESDWKGLIKTWADSLVEILRTQFGVEVCVKKGDWFDPEKSEAIQTVSSQELEETNYQPLQIVEVYKRGYMSFDKKIIRKAQVCTVNEGGE